MVRVTCAIFRAVFDSRSSFFSPRPHGNAIGVSPSRAPVFLSLTTSKRPLRRLFIFMLVVGTRPRVEPSEMFGPLIKNSGPAPF